MVPEAGEHREVQHKGGALALCETVQLLAQCHRQLRRLLSDRLGVLGLNDSEFMVLWLCQQAEPRGWVQRDLAAALGISPPQISSLVERLRQQGWLTSRRCQLDRRRQVWGIEPEGSRLLGRIGDDLQDLTASLDCSLSARQQTELTTLLRELAGWGAACPASAVKSSGDAAESSPLRLYRPDRAPQKQEENREEMHDAIAMRKTG